jgi:hypothetical protein
LSPVAAEPPRVKPDWLAGGAVKVLVPRGLNALLPAWGWALGVAPIDADVSLGLAPRLENILDVLPIIDY